MEQNRDKREVSPIIKRILDQDIRTSKWIVKQGNKYSGTRTIRNQATALEWSCNGIIWLCWPLATIWIFPSASQELLLNVLIAIIIDIIVVALIKAGTRRRRPSPALSRDIGPDKFSFPSGHASRAFLVFYLMLSYGISWFFVPPLLAWASCVAAARILAERHYLLDVLGGIGLGVVEGFIYSLIFWLSEETCKYLVDSLTDEKLSGGEYHV